MTPFDHLSTQTNQVRDTIQVHQTVAGAIMELKQVPGISKDEWIESVKSAMATIGTQVYSQSWHSCLKLELTESGSEEDSVQRMADERASSAAGSTPAMRRVVQASRQIDIGQGDVAVSVRIHWYEPSDSVAAFHEAVDVLEPAIRLSYERAFINPELRARELLQGMAMTQRQVARALLTSHSEQEIADFLHRSKHTVHDYIRDIYAHFGVRSRMGFVVKWNELMRKG